MLKLYQFPPVWNLPNPSPFCMKLETYLRMANIPFEVISVRDPRKAPNGKLPFIRDEGKQITDSGLIIVYLQQKYGDKLDSNLTSTQKAQALALRRMLEEHLYWVIVYSRWLDTHYWEITKNTFFSKLNAPLRFLLPFILQKKIQRDLYGQGIGRHKREEIYPLGLEDLNALHVTLGSQPFFMGNEPSSMDACAYAFLASILQPPIPSPLQDYVKSQASFRSYCERMQEKFYSQR